jgi:hypothetical protein
VKPPTRSTIIATHARVPATFTIAPGGALQPPTISIPSSFTVQLSVASSDGKAHRVLVRTPAPHTLSVPAAGRASALLAGLSNGTYEVDVDGVRRGALVIGSAPGP